jgi:TP901 family phage tail tape measure protein
MSGAVSFSDLFDPTGPGRQELDELTKTIGSLNRSVKLLSKNLDADGQRIAAGLASIRDQTAGLREQATLLSQAAQAEGTSLRNLQGQVADLAKQQNLLQQAQAGAARVQELAQEATKGYNGELKKQREALREAYAANDTQAIVKAAKEIQNLKLQSEELNRALRGANSSYTAAAGSFRAMENEARSLDAQLKALGNGMDADSAEAQQLKARLAEVNQSIISFTRDVNQGYKNVGRYAESIIEAVGALEKQKAALLANAQALSTQARVTGLSADEQQKLQTEIKQTEQRLNKVNGELRGYGVGLQESAAPSADFIGKLAGVYFALQNVSQAFSKVFNDNAEYSDSAAAVRKTTGQTAEEFDILRDKLDVLNTRTKLSGLLDEAAIGGQLGTAKDQIADFVEGLDISVQALEDDFAGGAEEIAKSLGKINSVFGKSLRGDIKTNLINIGAALNELSGTGASTAPFLADVALRVGAVAANAGLGLDKVLSYADVLETLGFTSEISGTSLQRLFNTLSNKREESFKIAKLADSNLTLKQFTKLINTDFSGALNLFLKGLNAGGTSTTKFNDLLGTLKLESGGAVSVITSLAKNIDLVAERQVVASQQLRVGTSVIVEAELKTNNFAGSWERLKKTISSSAVGSGVGNFFKEITDGFNRLLSMGNEKKLQDAKAREIQLSGEQIGANLRTANSARDLLARYEELTAAHTALQANGQKPTLQQTRELDLITLKLRDSLGDSIGKINQQTGAFELNTGAVKEAIQARLLLSNQTASTAFLRLDKLSQEEKSQKATVADLQRTVALRKQEVELQGLSLAEAQKLSVVDIERQAEGKGGLKGFNSGPIDKYNEAERQLAIATGKLNGVQALKAQQLKILNDLGLKNAATNALQTKAIKVKTDADDADTDGLKKKKKQTIADVAKEEAALAKQRLEERLADLTRQSENPANSEAVRADALKKAGEVRIQIARVERDELIHEARLKFANQIGGEQALGVATTRLQEAFSAKRLGITQQTDKALIALHNGLLDQLGEVDKQVIAGELAALDAIAVNQNLSYEERYQASADAAARRIELLEIEAGKEVRAAQGNAEKQKAIAQKLANDIEAIRKGQPTFDSEKAIDAQEASYDRLFLGLEGLHGKKLVSERNYQRQLTRLENDREREAIAALEREYGETAEVVARKLALRRKENKEIRDDEAETARLRGELINEGLNQVRGFSDAYFTIQANNNEAALNDLQHRKDEELTVAGDNLELKAQTEEKYRKLELEAKRKQAKLDKQQALFNVALNTAQAVTSVLSSGGGTHYLDFGITAGILTAFVIAQGLAQAVAIASKPLPSYFKGRRSGPAETALVAERGPELIGQESTGFRLVAHQAVTQLAAGDRVYTAPETRDVLRDHELISGRLVARQQQQDTDRQTASIRSVGGRAEAMATAEARAQHQQARLDTERIVGAILERPVYALEENGLYRYTQRQNSMTKMRAERYMKDRKGK